MRGVRRSGQELKVKTEPEVMEDIEEDVPVGFPDIVELERQKGRKVAVFPVGENDWMDMGQLPELEKMRRKLCGE